MYNLSFFYFYFYENLRELNGVKIEMNGEKEKFFFIMKTFEFS